MRYLALILVVLVLPTSAAAAAADYRHRMPLPPYVWAHHAANPACGIYPCATPETGEIWLPPGVKPFEVSHEIGHVWWYQVATVADRTWMAAKLGLPGEWVRETNMTSPDELAADAYAACDLGLSPRGKRSRHGVVHGEWVDAYSYRPSARKHRTICARIIAIGLVERQRPDPQLAVLRRD